MPNTVKQFKIGLSATDRQNMAQDIYEQVEALLFSEYSTSSTYNTGDYVVYSGQLYRCLADNVTGTWDATKWEEANLNDAIDDINEAVASVDNKANVDGNYPTMTVGVADQLSPYDEDSGDDQDEPFSFQATGTANETQSDFATGSTALLKEKQGNTIVVNQKIDNNTTSTGTGPRSWFSFFVGGQTYSFNNGEVTISSSTESTLEVGQTAEFPINHYVLLMIKAKINNGDNVSLQIRCARGNNTLNYNSFGIAETTYKTYYKIIQDTTNSLSYIGCGCNNTEEHDRTLTIKDFFAIDLTQMFNGNIPQDLLDNPENFFRYYQGSLAYNEGTLVNANGNKLVSTGRNIWDEEWELGGISSSTGQNVSETDRIRSKNYTKVIPNTKYYFKKGGSGYIYAYYYDEDKNFISYEGATNSTITTPSNCGYIRFNCSSGYGTTYNHDITISLYYTQEQGGEGYDQYYPYEAPYEVNTGTEVLRSAGSVKDSKLPSGEIIRRIGNYTFTGSEEWSSSGSGYVATITGLSNLVKLPSISSDVFSWQINNAGLISTSASRLYTGSDASGIGINTTGVVFVGSSDYANISNLTGKTIYFELATPTPEQGTSFSENLPIDDYGMLYWDNTNGVPQGANIFYQVNYKGFVDDMYSRVSGDSSQYVIKSDLTPYDNKDTQLLNAIGGTLRQCLCVKETLDFDNTDFVDLGTLSWNYDSTNGFMNSSAISDIKVPDSSTTIGKIMCSLLQTATSNSIYNGGNGIGIHTTKELRVRYSEMSTDATTFKNDMKGVLLAYEKAE